LYEGNKLVEYRYVDPATFTRIPAGRIPVISADARLKIQNKQAEIAKEQVEKQRVAALAKKEAAEKAEKAAATQREAAAICAAYHNYWFLIAYKSKNGNDMMFSDGVQKNIDNEYSGDKEYRDIRSKMFSQLSTINLGNPSQSEIQYVKSAAGFCVKAGFPIGQNTGR
jgi:hypothetical protein